MPWICLRLFACWLLLCVAASAGAATVAVDGSQAWPLGLHEQASTLKESSGVLSVEQAAARFEAEGEAAPQLHITPSRPSTGPATWLSVDFINIGNAPMPVVLVPGSPLLQQVDFYIHQDGRWRHTRAGSAVPMAEQAQASRVPELAFTLQPGVRVPVLVRAQSAKALKLNPRLYSAAAIQAREARAALWDGALVGGIMALGWSALLIFLFTRSSAFAWLSLLCVVVVLFETTIRGYTKLYLWPQAAEWGARSPTVLGVLSLFLAAGFILDLARTEGYKLPLRRVLLAFAGAQLALAIFALFGDLYVANWLSIYCATIFMATLAVIAIIFVRQQVPTARLMVLTTVFGLLSFALRIADDLGLIRSLFYWIGEDIQPNPVVALLGLCFNLVVLAAWISHVGKQRIAARAALATWQQSEQDRLREEVARQTQALNEALLYAEEKSRQKTQTLGYISHDLRAPLATIAGYVRLLNTQNEPQAEHIRAIERSVGYQLDLIDELMEYTKGELQPLDIVPVPTGLPSLLEEIASYAAALCARQHNQFAYEATSLLPANILADGRRLRQVLLNLLSNAAKFTHHGTIKLTVDAKRTGTQWLLRFAVQDNGTGIAIQSQSTIFDAFRQLQKVQGGVGLGLHIAQSIVQGMGAELEIRSAMGSGSIFSFQIQAQAVDEATAAMPAQLRLPRTTNTDSAQLAAPPAEHRLELAMLARDGRLSDIESWLENLQERHNAYLPFYDEVRRLLNILDFERIETLALSVDV